ncbi:MAG: STN domain-containing protein [Pseudomonadota bacterium]
MRTSFAAQGASPDNRIIFNIPSQPLADALVAYGAATGIEVYYDGTLASGRRSTLVAGRLTLLEGLEILLRGTGYHPRVTGPDTLTLERVPSAAALPGHVSNALIRRYEPYFAALQTRIAEALCGLDTRASNEIIISFVVSESGEIVAAESRTSTNDPARDAAIVTSLRGLRIDEDPPADLPQPVTMAIYPPSAQERPGCRP